jgi:outer membrane protein assembly factor BamA
MHQVIEKRENAARRVVDEKKNLVSLASVWLVGIAVLYLFGLAGLAAADEGSTSPKRVRQIRIIRGNVFDASEADRHGIFRVANSLHIKTRERVLRREFLVEEGELVDHQLLAATERAIRAHEFVNEARIVVVPVDDETVDIELYTHDSWTIVPGVLLETGGGISKLGVTATDKNLAGYGKTIMFQGVHDTDVGTDIAGSYNDPQVLGSHWVGHGSFKTGPLEDSALVALTRPYFSPDTKWAYGGHGYWQDETVRFFDSNSASEISRNRESKRSGQVFLSREFGARFNKFTAEVRYAYSDIEYTAIKGTTMVLPEDRHSLTASVALFKRGESFVKEKRIQKMTITEDIRLGYNVGVRLGRSGFPIPEGDKEWTMSGLYHHAFQIEKGRYLFLDNRVSTLIKRNTVLSLGGQYYHKWLPWQTLALNFRLRRSWNLDNTNQFALGGNSGLRGYKARRFNGDKSFLVNAESRLYSPIEILTVALGGVVFVDAGRAWDRGSEIDLAELKYSAGFGLRLGFTRAPNEPTSGFDIGFPLNSTGDYSVTIGSDHHF